MDLDYMMKRAKNCIDLKLNSNQMFELSDLFEKCEWDCLSKGDRIKLGKFFKNEVLDRRVPAVQFLGKNANNHAKYIKIKE